MRLNTAREVATLALCLALTGCATNRSEVKLAPTSTPAAAPATGKPVVIRAVRDARVFEEKPKDPSVPSLGFEGSTQASAEVKARAIGRKRNTYGMALGDVLLEPGDTVENRLRTELTNALHEAGYRVVSSDPQFAGAPALDIRILQFWSWITPGFWTITLSTRISTEITVPGASPPLSIDIRSSDAVLAATDGVWIESIHKALQRFRDEVVSRKAQLP